MGERLVEPQLDSLGMGRVPTGVVDGETPLDEAPPLWSRRVFGPSAVFTALAIGSGELLFWPGLSLPYGAGVLWLALGAVLLQWALDTEIARYSLATGESVAVGSARLGRAWSVILLLGAVVPWLWPGWARAGALLLSGTTGIAERPLSVASLILCGILLGAPRRVYALLEPVQSWLLGFILVGTGLLATIALATSGGSWEFWRAFVTGKGLLALFARAADARNADFMSLLGGLVFAGAGGILNLGYGLLSCEKQFGMGKYARPIKGLRHSEGMGGEVTSSVPMLPNDARTRQRFGKWMGLVRREHAIVFLGGNSFTIILLSLTFLALFGAGSKTQGMGFLADAASSFRLAAGPFASWLFVAVGFTIFFTSELGILDVTARLAAGILHGALGFRRLSPSAIYHLVVWLEISVGTTLTLLDPRQPYWFLVTSGVLNTAVMAVYGGLLLRLNTTALPEWARPSASARLAVTAATLLYGLLFIAVLWRL
jgi:hypothetical protein